MTPHERERIRLMVEVSRLYYDEQRSQQEIADRLDVSRATVSRTLTQARGEGLVRITIRDPLADEERLERALVETFGVRSAAVSRGGGVGGDLVSEDVAELGSHALAAALASEAVVGVTASRAVGAVARRLAPCSYPGATVVPLNGGWGPEGFDWHANANARTLAERMRCTYLQCNAPAFVASEATRAALLREPVIARVMEAARACTVALVGVGQLDLDASIVRSGYFTAHDLDLVTARGAVAQLGALFIDRRGEPVPTAFDARCIGIATDELRRIPTVIAVAAGRAKVEALRAALSGGWVHTLVTDAATAQGVLDGATQGSRDRSGERRWAG